MSRALMSRAKTLPPVTFDVASMRYLSESMRPFQRPPPSAAARRARGIGPAAERRHRTRRRRRQSHNAAPAVAKAVTAGRHRSFVACPSDAERVLGRASLIKRIRRRSGSTAAQALPEGCRHRAHDIALRAPSQSNGTGPRSAGRAAGWSPPAPLKRRENYTLLTVQTNGRGAMSTDQALPATTRPTMPSPRRRSYPATGTATRPRRTSSRRR